MGRKKQIPVTVKVNLFQHGKFDAEREWVFKKAQSLPVDIDKIVKDGEHQSYKSGKGPKPGSGWTHPSRVIGRVHALIEEGKNKEQAFKQIANERSCEYYTVKDIYYKALRGEYFRGVYRDKVSFEPEEITVSLENFLECCIKDCLNRKSGDRKKRVEQICQECGKENFKRALVAYIEMCKRRIPELLTNRDVPLEIKKQIKRKGHIEKAKSLLAQIS